MERIALVERIEMLCDDDVRAIVDNLINAGWKVIVLNDLATWTIKEAAIEYEFDLHCAFIITNTILYKTQCFEQGYSVIGVITERNKHKVTPLYAAVTTEHAVDFLDTAHKILRTIVKEKTNVRC